MSDVLSVCTLSVPPTPSAISSNASGGWNSSPDFEFSAVGGFGEGTVDHYNVAWDQDKTHSWDGSEPSWSAGTLDRSVTSSPTGWYLHLLGSNCAGVPNGSLDLGPFSYDDTAPTISEVRDLGVYNASRTVFYAWWTASDDESGISGYRYALGTTLGGADLVDWTDTTWDSANVTIPEQPFGEKVYFSVKARNGAGTWSDTSNSDGTMVAHLVSSIGEAKALAKGEPVLLEWASRVTGVYEWFYYIQDMDRCAGIMVQGTGPARGDRVQLGGVLAETNGEVSLTEPEIKPGMLVQVISLAEHPLLVIGRTLGGCDFPSGHDPNCGQKATKAWRWVKVGTAPAVRRFDPVAGLNNIGLLVRLAGKVSWVGPDSFYLDDGSAYDDTEKPWKSPGVPGVKVLLPSGVSAPPVGSCVSVTGISSCYESGGDLYRLLRVRDDKDIVTF